MQDVNKPLRIGSMNVRGLANNKKRLDVFDWLKGKNMDIYCLQDTHSDPISEVEFADDWDGKCILNSNSSSSRGVAILLSSTLKAEIKALHIQSDGNLIMAYVSILDNFEFLLITLYGPNKDDPNFYLKLKELLERETLPIIICGNWNLAQNYHLDTFGYRHENNKSAQSTVKQMTSVLDLTDPWRRGNMGIRKYTWFSSKAPRQMARLDFFLVTPDIL